MSLPGEMGDFAKGASGPASVYDTSPAGLGLSPSYLASASASASAVGNGTGLAGAVAGNGSIVAGTGFSVSRAATGVYNVTFTVAFAAVPVVMLTVGNVPVGNFGAAILNSVTTTGFQAIVGQANTDAVADAPWYFIVQALV